jgi:hypothetical protein
MADYTASYGSSIALVIGINSYQDARFVPLGEAEADAQAMANLLAGAPYNFTVDLLLGEQATRSNILQHLFRLRSAQPDDRSIIYFAGHGYTLTDNFGAETGYLAAADTVPEEDFTALELDEITNLRRQSKAKHITFIFDACFSGQALGLTRAASVSADKYLVRRAFQVISAGAGDQTVSDARSMTRLMLDLLSSDITDPQGLFTANDLGLYVQQRMAADSGQMQVPQFGQLQGSQGGDMVFRQSAGGLPRQVVEALESSSKYIRQGAVSELARLARGQQPDEAKIALTQLGRLSSADPDAQVRNTAQTYLDDLAQADPRITHTMLEIRKLMPITAVVPAVPASAVKPRPPAGEKPARAFPVPLPVAIAGGIIALGLLLGGLALAGLFGGKNQTAAQATQSVAVVEPGTAASLTLAPSATPLPDYSTAKEVSVILGAVDTNLGLTQLDCCGDRTESANIGGKQARKAIPGNGARFINFNVDNTFIFAQKTHVRVAVEYFDQGSFCFELDYDSSDVTAAYGGLSKPAKVVCLQNSMQWKTATFDLPDAYFADRLAGAADFRTGTPEDNDLYVDSVVVTKNEPATALPTDYSTAKEVSVDLGAANTEHGLTQVECCDGLTAVGNIGGRDARMTVKQSSARFIYFDVDDTFIFAVETHVRVAVDYFDQGSFCFSVNYDSTDATAPVQGQFKITSNACLADSGQWKTAMFDLPDAFFSNRQYAGESDFRIGSPDFDLHVSRVVVTKR